MTVPIWIAQRNRELCIDNSDRHAQCERANAAPLRHTQIVIKPHDYLYVCSSATVHTEENIQFLREYPHPSLNVGCSLLLYMSSNVPTIYQRLNNVDRQINLLNTKYQWNPQLPIVNITHPCKHILHFVGHFQRGDEASIYGVSRLLSTWRAIRYRPARTMQFRLERDMQSANEKNWKRRTSIWFDSFILHV